ncbi:Two-component sensor kinase [Anaerovibrio sp. JC8]|uniref:sensor histidine kinase n=1 Tax=Anaerovibrio sp. JC8 TaxID=1240085 RepID=UPI000A0BA17A|nr:histidine kinase [Anaerovibrio sp. JC8]ORU00232.1 Two-component sensor kinase [Anaerovibrio sp. JC8]
MHRYLESRLQRTLAWYALVPVLVMVFLGSLLMLDSWRHAVIQVNHEARELAADVLSNVSQDFLQRSKVEAEFLGTVPDISLWETDKGLRAEAFARLYHDTGYRGVDFYLLDIQGRLILGSQDKLPAELLPGVRDWGIWSRLYNRPDASQLEFLPQSDGQDLICGQAVRIKGQVAGFLIYILPSEYLQHLAGDGRAGIILVDRLDNARLVKSADKIVNHRKVQGEFLNKRNGLVSSSKGIYYVSQQDIFFGNETYRLQSVSEVSDLLMRYGIGVGAMLLVILLMVPLIMRSIAQETKMTAQAVDDLTVIAELRELESQFNPHFLFNTLENIKFMVRLDPGAATEMIMALSSLLRYSITSGGQQVELREDIKYLESYMKIQQYRFGSRLEFNADIESAARSAAVPKLLFQPLLENAIKYGEDEDGKLRISFQVQVIDGQLHVLVKDSGRGIEEEKLAQLRNLLESSENDTGHWGLFNVQRRLQLLYGTDYGLTLSCPPDGGTEISLRLPLTKKEQKNA